MTISKTNRRNMILVGVCLLHTLGLLCLLEDPSILLEGKPVLSQDWGYHDQSLRASSGFFSTSGKFWGYDPFFVAGRLTNTSQNLSTKLFETLALSTPFLTPTHALHLWIFVLAAGIPWLCWGAYLNFFRGSENVELGAVAAAALGVAYWWNSFPREMFFYGMVGFSLGSYVALWLLSLYFRAVGRERRSRRYALAWGGVCILILPLHLQAAASVVIPGAVILFSRSGEDSTRALWTAIGVTLAILANGFWLWPLVQYTTLATHEVLEELPLFLSMNPFTFALDYFSTDVFWTYRDQPSEKAFRIVLLVLGVGGLVQLIRRGDRVIGLALATGVASLFFLTYFGSFSDGLRVQQPLRFKVPLNVGLVVCSAYALTQVAASRRAVRVGAFALLATGTLGLLHNVYSTEVAGRMRLLTRVPLGIEKLVEELRVVAPLDMRILFEESGDETNHFWNGMYLSSFIPNWTGHQLVGGPVSYIGDFAEFHSSVLFKQPIQTLSKTKLRDYLERYNIGAVVAFHPLSVARFSRFEDLVTPVRQIGPVVLFRVRQKSNWFIEGSGSVHAQFDQLKLDQVRGDVVVLKYHWTEALTVDPPTKIEPVQVGDDPTPFIRLIDPPESLVISTQ